MALIVNERDLLLSASSSRTLTTSASISILISSPNIIIVGDSSGSPISYANSATNISVTQSGVSLEYGTTAGTFSVTAATVTPTNGVTLSTPTHTSTVYTIPSITYMSPILDAVKIVYTISIKDTENIEYLFYTSQVYNKVKNGTIGTPGFRGSLNLYITGAGPITSVKANAAVLSQTGASVNILGDMVTESNDTYVGVLKWDGSTWATPGTIIDGSLIVSRSITAAKINTNGLDIRDTSGNVIFSSGTGLAASKVTGLGTLATADGVTTSQVSGLGALATKDTVSSTYITSVSANTISAGTLGANVIYAGSISADNISAGTLGANVIYAGSISADNITSGTLTSMSISGGTVKIGTGTGPGTGAFEVNSAGVVWSDNLFCRAGRFEGYPSATLAACQGVTYGAGSGTRGSVAASNSSSSAHGVVGNSYYKGTSGIIGCANGYNFYADGTGVGDYGTFTGAHDAIIPIGHSVLPGDMLVDVQVISRGNISNVITEVAISTIPNQKGVVGILSGSLGVLGSQMLPNALRKDRTYFYNLDGGKETVDVPYEVYSTIKDTHEYLIMNSLGEGQLNVCGEGGNILSGDLIVSSSIPGKGMKQEDEIIRSYTVAKSREDVTFSSPTEVKLVACIYICG